MKLRSPRSFKNFSCSFYFVLAYLISSGNVFVTLNYILSRINKQVLKNTKQNKVFYHTQQPSKLSSLLLFSCTFEKH